MLDRLILLVAPISAVSGAAAFVVTTIYLAFERCFDACTRVLEGMNRTPSLSLSGIIIASIVLVLACVGRQGRAFAIGFFAAFVASGIATSGDALFLWGYPTRSRDGSASHGRHPIAGSNVLPSFMRNRSTSGWAAR